MQYGNFIWKLFHECWQRESLSPSTFRFHRCCFIVSTLSWESLSDTGTFIYLLLSSRHGWMLDGLIMLYLLPYPALCTLLNYFPITFFSQDLVKVSEDPPPCLVNCPTPSWNAKIITFLSSEQIQCVQKTSMNVSYMLRLQTTFMNIAIHSMSVPLVYIVPSWMHIVNMLKLREMTWYVISMHKYCSSKMMLS